MVDHLIGSQEKGKNRMGSRSIAVLHAWHRRHVRILPAASGKNLIQRNSAGSGPGDHSDRGNTPFINPMPTRRAMSDDHKEDPGLSGTGMSRRKFINTTALVGLTLGVAACDKTGAPGADDEDDEAGAEGHASPTEVKPGELDTYYGLWSGGHNGDMRVLGLPSGREIHRIPCFVPDVLVGWGITNESKAVMGTKPDGTPLYQVADTHHTHASYKDGNYDGRYAWINDKINARIARIRLDYFVCDKITDLPNVQGFHGACSAAASSPSRFPTTAMTSMRRRSIDRCSAASMPNRWKCAGRC